MAVANRACLFYFLKTDRDTIACQTAQSYTQWVPMHDPDLARASWHWPVETAVSGVTHEHAGFVARIKVASGTIVEVEDRGAWCDAGFIQ